MHLPDEIVRALTSRTWSGNVRELRNAVMAYVALGTFDPGAKAGDAVDAQCETPLRAGRGVFA